MSNLGPAAWQLALVLVVLLLNAFFVAFEYALVSIRRTRVQELMADGSKRASDIDLAIQSINRYVSATQVGVTMCSLAIGWLGEPAVESLLEGPLHALGAPDGTATAVAVTVVAFMVITYLHVVIGEIVPKNIALQKTETVGLGSIGVMKLFVRLTSPLVYVLSRSAELILRLFGLRPAVGMHLIHSEEELKMLVSQSSKGGVLEDSEQEMLYNVFDFADTDVSEVMVPRPDVIALAIGEAPAELLHRIIEEPYTRYPVYRDTMDNIVGILHIRDLFRAAEKYGKDKVRIDALLRPAHVVPESKSLAGLLADFRRSKSHMALVVDEYGSLAGIVTLEDVIEEIVGEIDDEHDVPEEPVEHISENHIRVDGKFPIEELNERFKLNLPEEDHHSIGGFVFGVIGQQPHEGDVVRHENLRIEVTETDGPRIVHVDIFMLDRTNGSEKGDEHPQDAPPEIHSANGPDPASRVASHDLSKRDTP